MAKSDFDIKTPKNYEEKTICAIVSDVSWSMNGEPINELNKGLHTFHEDIIEDTPTADRLEVAIVEFSSDVEVVQPPALVSDFQMPSLEAKGTTKLADGIREAISLVEDRKQYYKETGQNYLRPWIIVLTDGDPDSDQNMDELAKEIEDKTKSKKFVFLPIGVQGANMDILNQIAGYVEQEGSYKKMPALPLAGLKFHEFFKWMSASMRIVANAKEGEKVNIPPVDKWIEGYTV